MELIHTCMNVSSADKVASWYVEELGFSEAWEFTTPDGTRNVYVADDAGHELQLADAPESSPGDPGSAWDHVAIEVEDVDRTFEAVDDYGVVREPTDYDSIDARIAFVRDPDGRVIELVEFTA